ncbi:oligosaccharide flippase family protein [bacterium]|nr:oligosaccharide flippase family protein [bacterium]
MTVGKKALRGIGFMSGRAYVTMVIGFFVSVIMARLVAPKDFGLFALAIAVYNIAARARSFGFNYLVIRRKELNNRVLFTHLVSQISMSFLVLLLLFSISPILSNFYGKDFIPILLVIGMISLFDKNGLSSTPVTYIEKNIDYKQYTIIFFAAFIISSLIGVYFAWLEFGVWSLVIRFGANVVIICILSWIICSWRPKFDFDFKILKEFFKKGKHLWLTGVAGWFMLSFDDFLVGTMIGAKPLGYYNRAYKASRIPYGLIGSVLQVAYPVYSKYQDDKEKLSKVFSLVLSFLARVSFFFAFGIFIIIPEFTRFFYGQRWLPLVPYLRFLLLYSLLRPMYDATGSLLVATGREKELMKIGLTLALFMLILVPPVVYYFQVRGAAFSVGIMVLLGVILQQRKIKDVVSIKLIKIFLFPVISLLIAAFACFKIDKFYAINNLLFKMIFKGLIFAIIYLLLLFIAEGKWLLKEGIYLYKIFKEKT